VPQAERVVYTTKSEMHRILGMNVTLPEIAAGLHRLDFVTEPIAVLPALPDELGSAAFGLRIQTGEPLLRCIAPWHRLDIQVPADLTEELARIIGYEHIDTTLMDDVLPTQHRNHKLETEENIRDILVGCGLQETISYSLTTVENHDKFNRGKSAAELNIPFVTLLNPLSVKRNVMRRSMQVSALENLAYNYRYTQRYAVFEIGRVYRPENGDGVRPQEDSRLCVLLTGPRRPSSLFPDPAGAENFDFFDLKGVIDTMLQRLGFAESDTEYIAVRDNPTYTGTCATLKLQGASLGIIGEIDPQVLLNFEIPTDSRVYAAEMHLKPLIKPSWQLQPMTPISNYQPVVEDLAFVVTEEIPAAQVLDAIRKGGGSLLTKVELFDIYRGPQIAPGHKSLAYNLTYESTEKPLTEKQIVDIRNRIIRRVAESVNGKLRE
jgi:phenylalanyl-tRNA synthetase beta chain